MWSLVYPYFIIILHCVSAWGSTCQWNLSRIIILQKKIITIISSFFMFLYWCSFQRAGDFKILWHLFIPNRYTCTLKFMYLFKRSLHMLLNYFQDTFTLASQIDWKIQEIPAFYMLYLLLNYLSFCFSTHFLEIQNM